MPKDFLGVKRHSQVLISTILSKIFCAWKKALEEEISEDIFSKVFCEPKGF